MIKPVKIQFFEDFKLRDKDSMKNFPSKPFDHFLHPYIFVLKEGQEIQKDFLDYSLLLLQVGRADVLPSPHHLKSIPATSIQMIKR